MKNRWLRRIKKAGVMLLSAIFVLSVPMTALADGQTEEASEEAVQADSGSDFANEVEQYLADCEATPGEVLELNMDENVYFLGSYTASELEVSVDEKDAVSIKQVLENTVNGQSFSADVSGYNLTVDDVTKLTSDMLNDNPQFFFVEDVCAEYNEADHCVDKVFFLYSTDASDERERYEQAVARILSGINDNWSDEFKLFYLHDYLVTHCEYDLSLVDHTAYGAIVEGSTVCQGYALAYKDLGNRLGIPTEYVSSNAINHGWNLVTLNGKHYYVDCTWDDYTATKDGTKCHWYEQLCDHKNFLKSRDAMVSTNHSGSDWKINGENITELYNDKEFDNASWSTTRSPVVILGDKIYFLNGTGSSGEIYLYSGNAQTPLNVMSSGYNYYGSLVNIGNTIFLSKTNAVYKIDLNSKTMTAIRTLTSAEQQSGSIYGMHASGTTLYCDIATSYCDIDRKMILDVDASSYIGDEVSSVTLDKDFIHFDSIGEKVKINATVLPSGTVDSWESTNPDVATVNQNGYVTSVGRGRANIIAKSGDKKAICVVSFETIWQDDWTYVLSQNGEENRIFLDLYNGSETNLCVPAVAVIGGQEYKTTFRGFKIYSGGGFGYNGILRSNSTVQNFSTEPGVKFFIAYPGMIYRQDQERFPQNLKYSFYNCSAIRKIDLSNCDTSEIEDFYYSFNGCTKLEEVDLSGCEFTKLTSASYLLNGCNNLTCIKTPKYFPSTVSAALPKTMYELKKDGTIGTTGYTDLKDAPRNSTLVIPIPVTAVTLNTNTLEMNVGEKESLTVTVTPSNATSKAVNWSSTDDSIVSVDANGHLTAKKEGEAIIVVSTMDGSKSDRCTVTVINTNPVSPKPTLTQISNGVKVSWEADPNAEGYCVFRKPDGGSWVILKKTTMLSFEDTTGVSGKRYTYAVRCTNADGSKYTSAFDNTKVASIDYPLINLASPMPVLSAVNNKVQVTWTAVEGSPKYRVFRQPEGGSWKKLADVSTPSYTDESGVGGSKYIYAVRCLSSDGTAMLSPLDKTKLASITYPATELVSPKPVLTSANDGINISWTAVSGSPKYRIFKRTGGAAWTVLTDVSGTSYKDTVCTSGTKYTYAVRCLAEDGTTLISKFDSTKTAEITYQNGELVSPKPTLAAGSDGINISWSAVSGSPKYRIFKRTGTAGWTILADVSGTSYKDTNCTSGTKYTYAIRCLSEDGTLLSKFDSSKTAELVFPASEISSPKPTLASVSSGISVSWTAVDGAAKYRIFKRTGTAGWTVLTDVSETSYIDTACTSGTKYTYAVRCLDASGNLISKFDSNATSVITK